MENKIQNILDTLSLIPHPEGGFYKEVYRSEGILKASTMEEDFSGDRNFCTSIYFLLTRDNFSAFHRLKQDEIWNFYDGNPLQIHVIDPEGNYHCQDLGLCLANNLEPQYVVPAGSWFASSVKEAYSLVGCTVAPGFDFEDFELADRNALIRAYPQHKEIIKKLTRI